MCFHGNNGYTNMLQCYMYTTYVVLSKLSISHYASNTSLMCYNSQLIIIKTNKIIHIYYSHNDITQGHTHSKPTVHVPLLWPNVDVQYEIMYLLAGGNGCPPGPRGCCC